MAHWGPVRNFLPQVSAKKDCAPGQLLNILQPVDLPAYCAPHLADVGDAFGMLCDCMCDVMLHEYVGISSAPRLSRGSYALLKYTVTDLANMHV